MFRDAAHLRTPEVEDHRVDRRETDEDGVIPPADPGQRGRRDLDVDQGGDEGADEGPGHALRADVGGEDLG